MFPDSADIAVVGAGAAGLMAAISAARTRQGSSPSIVLLDSREKIGAKILISGGTRCNVTNRLVRPADYNGAAGHYLKHAFEAFTPEETIHFFREIGVELVLEPSGKYFPNTHSGRTVLEALMRECERRSVQLVTGKKIVDVQPHAVGAHSCAPLPRFVLMTETGETMHARAVVLATGGLSLPETGSDGTGLQIAEKLGHTILRTAPALTPLLSEDKDWSGLSGVTLEDVRLDLYLKGKKSASARGGFLFTHFGFSGPAALDISRHWALAELSDEPRVWADFLPEKDEKKLPKRFYETLKKKCPPAGQAGGADLEKRIHHYPLEVTGVYGYKKAEATAGGVDLKEVNIATLESKKVPGLFFAGEILDVDGRIGGFNFQWAWSTGAIAGRAVVG